MNKLDLHNKYALELDGLRKLRIMEYEYYDLDDPFTHGNERQKDNTPNPNSLCGFYVHRSKPGRNDSYKGGTFKGIDIVKDGAYLIRSIMDGHNSKIIEGPCNVVNYMCEGTGWTLQQLETKLQLVNHDWNDVRTTYLGARVGLTLKRAPEFGIKHWAKYLVAPYRSCIFIPDKGKDTFFVINPNRTDISYKSTRPTKEIEKGKQSECLTKTMTQLEVAGYLISNP